MAREPVAWNVAERVASLVGGREPYSRSYHLAAARSELEDLVSLGESLVTRETGLTSPSPARVVLTDRAGWVRANIDSFRRLLGPLLDRLAKRPLPGPVADAGRLAAGVQMGLLLGWMSTRVLGQYDLLLVEEVEERAEQDIVYLVAPNLFQLEHRYGFPPREFRLWVVLHELTHRAQFTGVPWLRPYFSGLVSDAVGGLETDPRQLLERVRRVVGEIAAGRNPIAEAGIVALVASAEQRLALGRLQALMALLEGHGDVVMDRAGGSSVPSAARFAAVLHERRGSAQGLGRLVGQLLGIEAKLRQYEQGERFIAAIEAEGGPELLSVVWRGPDWLPGAEELAEPDRWVRRVRPGAA